MKDEEFYRKQALESLYERNEFQQGIQIITPKSWIYLIIIFLLLLIGFFWLFFGKITTLVDGQGIILAKDAEIINIMSPISAGYVKTLSIRPGIKVKKGQIIATLMNPNMAGEAKELKRFIQQEKDKLNSLTNTADNEINTRLKRIQESINNALTIQKNLEEKKSHLEALLKIQEGAFKKGILSRLELNDMQVAYYDAKEQISKNQNALVELNQNKNDYIESWNTKIRESQDKVTQAEFNLNKLLQNLQLTETVLSPVDGIISSQEVKVGDFLTEKQKLANIISYSKDLEVIAFFNSDVGKKIKLGMPAKIFPKHLNPLEYGGIEGTVVYISELPISPQSIEAAVENQKLVDKFIQSGPVFKAKISLTHSDKTFSGYRWTTSKGPAEKLSIGAIANVEIIVKKQHPLTLIVPILRTAKNWVMSEND